ncbi:hypothetical protein IM793_12535 [Pedobacter sp. MR2016-19]|uniref:hypothetical protein n=1 Tax=Pedobacter sp. MR2016-19 TaxID=2780089 RepID=UPI001877323A|nr:hypothetical protein [Pedobacter sp. MR2016-19]MBE5319991.1 hypothetical protein [Pedobacter sp. MR2016-19]
MIIKVKDDFRENFRELTDNDITALIDKAIINYPHQKTDAMKIEIFINLILMAFTSSPVRMPAQ